MRREFAIFLQFANTHLASESANSSRVSMVTTLEFLSPRSFRLERI